MDTQKPGWHTTEFWLTLLLNLVGIINLFHPIDVPNEALAQIAGIVAMVCTSVAYIYSRAIVKSKPLVTGGANVTTTVKA